jgi:hypothetical protein
LIDADDGIEMIEEVFELMPLWIWFGDANEVTRAY